MTRRLNWILLILLVVVGAPYYWLLRDNRPGDVAAKPITIEQLRSLAQARPGAAPTSVEVELIAFRRLPGDLFAAGTGLKRRMIGVMAWRLPVPGKGPIVIDSGIEQAAATEMGMEQFDKAAWQRVVAGMAGASTILITHEHPDHIGGLISWAGSAALIKAQLNGPQSREVGRQTMVPVNDAAPQASGAPYAAAPGVVVIPAASHTPGSQMIFVRLSGGREYLFTGDIATLSYNWQELRARSRLIGDHFAPENRGEVYAWLKTIRALRQQAPNLIVLPGHDYEWVINPRNQTGVRLRFTAAPD